MDLTTEELLLLVQDFITISWHNNRDNNANAQKLHAIDDWFAL